MHYSIGEVSEQTGIPVSTLRYYDREGMFPNIERKNGGIRSFSEEEVATLGIVECLKNSGLSIKEIKQFLDWCEEGDASLEKRRDLFYRQLDAVQQRMAQLQDTLDTVRYKCWYYDTACAAGSERAPHSVPDNKLPNHIREYRQKVSSN